MGSGICWSSVPRGMIDTGITNNNPRQALSTGWLYKFCPIFKYPSLYHRSAIPQVSHGLNFLSQLDHW
jgi:hypothetical protein